MIYALAVGAAVTAGCSAYLAALGLTRAGVEAGQKLRLQGRLASGRQRRTPAVLKRIAIGRVMKTSVAATLSRRLADAGVSGPDETTLWLLAAPAPALTFLTWLLRSLLPAAMMLGGVCAGINVWLKRRAGDRLERFSEQLPAVFKLAAAAIKAGSSLQQALLHASAQSGPPAQAELAAVNQQIALGMPVDEALEALYRRLPAIELNFILMGLSIQRRIGGNLVNLLEETTKAVEERRRLRRHLKVETAQARLSAQVIGFLPLLVAGSIAFIDPSFIAPLFTTPAGLAMLAVAVAAETVGFLLLGRILEIEI